MLEIGAGEGDGLRALIDAKDLERGEVGREDSVHEEGDAAGAGAEIENAKGRGGRIGGIVTVEEESVGKVCRYCLGLRAGDEHARAADDVQGAEWLVTQDVLERLAA